MTENPFGAKWVDKGANESFICSIKGSRNFGESIIYIGLQLLIVVFVAVLFETPME
jgi:hypothetical protein